MLVVAASALIAVAATAVGMTAERELNSSAVFVLILLGPTVIAGFVTLVWRRRRAFNPAAIAAVLAMSVMLGAANASGDLDSHRAVVFFGTSFAAATASGIGAVAVGIAISLWPRPPA